MRCAVHGSPLHAFVVAMTLDMDPRRDRCRRPIVRATRSSAGDPVFTPTWSAVHATSPKISGLQRRGGDPSGGRRWVPLDVWLPEPDLSHRLVDHRVCDELDPRPRGGQLEQPVDAPSSGDDLESGAR